MCLLSRRKMAARGIKRPSDWRKPRPQAPQAPAQQVTQAPAAPAGK